MTLHRPLTDNLSVAPQITEDDIREAAAAGYRTIVNNRPDGEEPGQLDSLTAENLATELGLEYVYLPVTMQTIPANVRPFAEVLEDHPGPILAHCRSGTRCTILWGMAEAAHGKMPIEEIQVRAGRAGYDLSGYGPVLEALRRGKA